MPIREKHADTGDAWRPAPPQAGREGARKPIFPLVDVLRAFAALTVLVYHLIAHWEWSDFPASGPFAWLREGWMAVDLFFVISGFVIGLSAFSRLEAGHGRGFVALFLRSRLVRVVPLHYLTLAAYILLVEPSLRQQGDFWANVLAHLLFVHNLFLPYAGAINGPNWSLGTEMQFYLLVAVVAPWLCKARSWVIASFVVVAWAWRWGVHALFLPGPLDAAYFAQTQLPGMLDEFAIGMLLARFVRTPAGERFLARLRSDARVRWGLAALAAASWWAVLAVLQSHDYWDEVAMAVFFRTALACSAALVLLLLCGWPMPQRPVLLRVPLYLGKTSYGVYLWHVPVLFLLGRHTELEPLTALLVAVPATLGLAAFTWHFFEEPLLRRWGRPASGGVAPLPAPRRARAAV